MNDVDFEYAIRRDVQNGGVVRTIDRARHRELWIWVAVGAALLGVLLVTAFQYHEFIAYGYGLDDVKGQIKVEQQIERQLRLEITTLQSPRRLERIATKDLQLVAPAADRAVVVERVTTSPAPSQGIVASR